MEFLRKIISYNKILVTLAVMGSLPRSVFHCEWQESLIYLNYHLLTEFFYSV